VSIAKGRLLLVYTTAARLKDGITKTPLRVGRGGLCYYSVTQEVQSLILTNCYLR
jgi:hypothetical protein